MVSHRRYSRIRRTTHIERRAYPIWAKDRARIERILGRSNALALLAGREVGYGCERTIMRAQRRLATPCFKGLDSDGWSLCFLTSIPPEILRTEQTTSVRPAAKVVRSPGRQGPLALSPLPE